MQSRLTPLNSISKIVQWKRIQDKRKEGPMLGHPYSVIFKIDKSKQTWRLILGSCQKSEVLSEKLCCLNRLWVASRSQKSVNQERKNGQFFCLLSGDYLPLLILKIYTEHRPHARLWASYQKKMQPQPSAWLSLSVWLIFFDFPFSFSIPLLTLLT